MDSFNRLVNINADMSSIKVLVKDGSRKWVFCLDYSDDIRRRYKSPTREVQIGVVISSKHNQIKTSKILANLGTSNQIYTREYMRMVSLLHHQNKFTLHNPNTQCTSI